MKILFIDPFGDAKGHVGDYMTHLSQEWGRLGHKVTVFTNELFPETYIQETPLFKVCAVGLGKYSFKSAERHRRNFPLYRHYQYIHVSYEIFRDALDFANKNCFDGIYIMDLDRVVMAVMLQYYRNPLPPIVLEIHSANFSYRQYEASLPRKIYKMIQRKLMKNVIGFDKPIKALHMLGDWNEEQIRSQLLLSEDFPILAMGDGTDIPKYKLDQDECRKRLNINYNGPLLLMFGMIRKDKGLDVLFDAVSKTRDINYKVLVAGDPTEYSEKQIRDWAAKHQISEKVILHLGYVPQNQMYSYLFAADVAVFPYHGSYTASTGPMRKAVSCGLPVIVTDVSEMGRITKQYRLGSAVEPENPNALAEAIRDFLDLSREDYHQLSERSLLFARENTWQALANRLVDLFNQVM